MTVSNPFNLPERIWRAVIGSIWILNPLVVLALLPSVQPLSFLPWSSLINETLKNALPESMRVPMIEFAIPIYVVRELIWFFLHGQYLLIAKFDLFPSYKIPQNARAPFDVQWFMFDAMNVDHLVTMPLLLAICIYSFRYLSISIDWTDIPSVSSILCQILVARIIREFLRYWGHRFLHYGPFYKWIHKKHHEYTSPFSLVGEYAHPIENLIHGVLPILVGLFTVAQLFDLHLVTIFADLFHTTVLSVEEHTGYLLPWNIDYWPILRLINGGSPHHDLHHKDLNGNYGERYWDRLFGTDFETIRQKRSKKNKKEK